jgi:hypothetical protein
VTSSEVDTVLDEIEAWNSGRLWGAKLIASVAGVSVDTVPRWAELPDCPIKKCGGRYFVRRAALVAWMTEKAA